MNNCWYKLKVDCPVINSQWNFPTPNNSSGNGVWRLNIRDIVDAEWLKYIEKLNIPIVNHAMLFYRPSNFNTNFAHIDIKVGSVDCDISGLNFVVGGEDSDMIWYELPKKEKKILYTVAETPYINWPIDELKEIDKTRIQSNLTLVRVDVPHAIIMGEKPRWAISIRLKGNIKTWDKMVEMFQTLNLLDKR